MALIKSNQIETGVKPNQIVALDNQGKLPAIDGSQLTNLPTSRDIESYKDEIIERLSKSEAEIIERVLSAAEVDIMNRTLLKSVEIIEEPEEEYEEPELTLDETVVEALLTINALAENTRQLQLGVGPAQMMVYAEKFEEASDYLVDDMPDDLSKYPFIDAEVGATGRSAEYVANSIIDKKGEWISFNAKVERIRMVAKTHILESQTLESVDNIVKLAVSHLDKLVD